MRPKFSEVLREYAKGYLKPYDPARYSPGVGYYVSNEEILAEQQAKCVASAFNQLAELYEKYEQQEEEINTMEMIDF